MNRSPSGKLHRRRGKSLGLPELIAIALGGMVGGGIFTILGISVSMIGAWTPVAIVIGGVIAAMAAYSYVKLGVYYRDEGASYAFFKRTYPNSPFAASLLGWWVVFGYISTLALYAYTFAAYALSGFAQADSEWLRKAVAGGVILVFTLINVWSVRGMGRIEDLTVYAKLAILVVISFVLIINRNTSLPALFHDLPNPGLLAILTVASITFVAFEGFQLVINAVEEMERPERNIPLAIYSAIILAILIYVVIALGAILTIPFEEIIRNKEYALAAGAADALGHLGRDLVIMGALLATSSAISSTVFGSSRQMASLAQDGFLPAALARRRNRIPANAIVAMSLFAFVLVLVGDLRLILEFGSVTFLLVSFLMAVANFRIRRLSGSSPWITVASLLSLGGATVLILYFEARHQPQQLVFIIALYVLLSLGAWSYAALHRRRPAP